MNRHNLTHTLFAAALALAMLLLLCATRPAQSALGEPPMTVCKDQAYALCAAARCNVFDGVAYCQCDVKSGNSISLVFQMGKGDVCSVNASGPENGFMVSTFSLPASIVAPHGDHAIYSCPRGPSEGAYAQCDGGLCFAGTGPRRTRASTAPCRKGRSCALARSRRAASPRT